MSEQPDTYTIVEVEQIMAGYYGRDATPMIRTLCRTVLAFAAEAPQWVFEEVGEGIDPMWRLPVDVDAEEQMIGTILLSETPDRLVERLEPHDFYDPTMRFIFGELRMMLEAGEAFVTSGMLAWLRSPASRRRRLEKKGAVEVGAALLAEIGRKVVTVAHAEHYLARLKTFRVRRGIHILALKLRALDVEQPREPMATIEWGTRQFDNLWAVGAEIFPAATGVEA